MAYTTWPEYFVIFANIYGAREFSLAGARAEFWERKINHFTSSFLSWKCTSLLKTNSEIRFPRFPKNSNILIQQYLIFSWDGTWHLNIAAGDGFQTSFFRCLVSDWIFLYSNSSCLGLNLVLFKFIWSGIEFCFIQIHLPFRSNVRNKLNAFICTYPDTSWNLWRGLII